MNSLLYCLFNGMRRAPDARASELRIPRCAREDYKRLAHGLAVLARTPFHFTHESSVAAVSTAIADAVIGRSQCTSAKRTHGVRTLARASMIDRQKFHAGHFYRQARLRDLARRSVFGRLPGRRKLTALASAEHSGAREVAFASIAELQSLMSSGDLSSRELVEIYLRRIRAIDKGLDLRSVHPAESRCAPHRRAARSGTAAQAARADRLHGIPILLKDNIDTADRSRRPQARSRSPVPRRCRTRPSRTGLRDAGAVILGKANLSEWANFRGFQSSSGWSGVGRQCRNPHILDRNPCGSSSGSAAAVAAALAAAALGTETDGSIVCPSGQCGVAGIKPTVGSDEPRGRRADLVHAGHGGHAWAQLADAAAVLGALTGADPRDPKTAASAGHFFRDYRQFINPNGLAGARIGVARQFTGVDAGDRRGLRAGAASDARCRRSAHRSSRDSDRSMSSTPTSPRSSC